MSEIMNNYSLEEICSGCEFSHWHVCENCYCQENPRFCHCEIGMEEYTDTEKGTCPTYKYQKPEKEKEETEKLCLPKSSENQCLKESDVITKDSSDNKLNTE